MGAVGLIEVLPPLLPSVFASALSPRAAAPDRGAAGPLRDPMTECVGCRASAATQTGVNSEMGVEGLAVRGCLNEGARSQVNIETGELVADAASEARGLGETFGCELFHLVPQWTMAISDVEPRTGSEQ